MYYASAIIETGVRQTLIDLLCTVGALISKSTVTLILSGSNIGCAHSAIFAWIEVVLARICSVSL